MIPYDKVRRFPRLKTLAAAQIATAGDDTPVNAFAVQLSEGGCLLRVKHRLGEGRIVLLHVAIGTSALRVISKVLYEHPDDSGDVMVGVSFVSLFPEELLTLREFIGLRLLSPETRQEILPDPVTN